MRRYAFYDHGTLSNDFTKALDSLLPTASLVTFSDGGRNIVMHTKDIKLVRAYDLHDPDPVAIIVPFDKWMRPIATTTRLGSFTVPLFRIRMDQWLPLSNVRQVHLSPAGVEAVHASHELDPAAECAVVLRNGETVMANERACVASFLEHYGNADHLIRRGGPVVEPQVS